jgi:hypothetical protein
VRNHLEIIKDIEQYLSDNKWEWEHNDLKNEVFESSTASELCMRVGAWLIYWNEITGLDKLRNEFMEYCHHNGLYPMLK